MTVSAEHIESAAKALKLDPDVQRRLTEPSQSRALPVRLRLLGHEPIYVSTQETARDLECTDRAYDAVTTVTAAWPSTAPPPTPGRRAVPCPLSGPAARIPGMTTFVNHQHPRAAAAFRAQFGAAPDAEVDGEYCFEGPNRQVLKIQATGRVAVNFPGPTRFAAEAGTLSVMEPLPLGRLGSDLDGEVCRWLVGPDDFNAEDALKFAPPMVARNVSRPSMGRSSGSSSEGGQTRPCSCRFCCRRWHACYGATSRHRAKTSLTASDSPRSTVR